MNVEQHGIAPPPIVGVVSDPARLYRLYVRPGDLVFDIGAHVGTHTAAFLRLGCRVVAVEPQRWEAQRIPAEAQVVCAAVKAFTGKTTFWRSEMNTYVSTTMDDGFREHVHAQAGYVWDAPVEVECVTLDDLIGRYGEPAFCKIDVEGAEADVLTGLHRPLRALSFEVHDFDPGKAARCVALLDALATYEYAYSPMESFTLEAWPPKEMPLFGDVYASRRLPPAWRPGALPPV